MKSAWKIWFILVILVVGAFFALSARINAEASNTLEADPVFTVSAPVEPVLSTAVRDLPPASPEPMLNREVYMTWLGEGIGVEGPSIGLDPLVSRSVNDGFTPTPLVTFEGVPSLSGVTPPDTNGDVGPNHYVQMTNFSFRIWDKGDPDNSIPPTPLIAPTLTGDLFAPLGGQCTSNFGDPIVLYDDMADRWLLSQFGLSGPLGMCIAISQTPDPTGAYFLYFFPTPDFPDYPKLGAWPDAYYMGTNSGFPNAYYSFAFDRVSMLAGLPATVQSFGGLPNLMMPADADGPTAPPAGAPGIFYTFFHPSATGHPPGPERLAIYEFDVDWVTPANSTYTLVEELPIAAFNYTICGFFAGGCIAQPGTGQLLDDIAWWPMFRFQYRNFDDYAAMVGNFTVDADGANHAGIRWFEVRKTGSTYTLEQEGTHFPTTDSRWMGSIAMDGSGNIALGYSVSSSSVIPSIRYATRLLSDPPGTLSAEAEMWTGAGVQTGIHRWGDYSNMAVDPVDNCTFWYTTEYHDTNDSGFNWNTRVGVFRIPECSGSLGPNFSMSLDPTALEICSPAAASVDVNFSWLDGYSAPVALSALGVPTGYSAGFSVNPVVSPTVTSELSLTNVGAVTPGAYAINIVGIGTPTPTHTATLQLNLFDAVPGAPTLTSPADGAINVSLAPTFAWNAAAQGFVYDLDVATDSGFTNIVYSVTDVDDTQHTMTTALDPLSTYYWRVRANNACGSGSYSSTFSFTTEDIPPILVVDDDSDSPDVVAYYTDALDAIGAQYDVWDTNGSDNEPTATDLAPYDAVIWFTGVLFGGTAGPGPAGEAALGSWLDNGNCMLISSQDYLYDRGQTAFMSNYLGMASGTSDVGQTTVTGAGSVFTGLGPYSLVYPFTNYSDIISPNGTAELAFSGNQGDAAINKDSGVYRTTFWGFPFEAIPTAGDRQAAMQTVLNWCGALGATGTLAGTVTDADSSLGIEGATITAVGPGTFSTQTNANGDYSITLPIGTYDVTASADNYVPVTVNSIDIMTGTTTTQDFVLQGSALTYSPPEIEESMEIGDVVSNTVTVTNTGPLPIDWEVTISNYGGPLWIQQVAPAYVPPAVTSSTGSSLQQFATEKANNIQVPPTAAADAPDLAVLLDQQPNQVNGLFSDSDCGLCGTGAQSIAENFSLASTETIGQIIFWTGYFPGDVPIDPDLITVIFHEDAGGFPGAVVSTESNVPYERVQTGVILFGVHEWMHTLTLAAPVTLGPGNYWVEIFNATVGSSENFFWETGNPDTVGNGLTGSAWSTSVPGSSWNFDGATELAVQLVTGSGGTQWAYAVPDSGTIPANSVATFEVVFDASSLYQTGDYTADLNFSGTFVNVVETMPLTMHLSCSTCGFLEGDITDSVTGDPVDASIHITSTSGFDVTLSGSNYAVAVQPGTYHLTVSADGYFDESATVTVAAGQTVVTDFALVFINAILEYSPASYERTLALGQVLTDSLAISNTGSLPFDYELSDIETGSPVLVTIPASDGNFPRGAAALSMGPVPQGEGATGQPASATLEAVLGANAYSVEHVNLFYTIFDIDVPAVLPNIGPMPATGGFIGAGEYVNGSVYMVDTTNVMWEVDPATGAILNTYTATPPGGGETYSGMAFDPTSDVVYAATTSCAASSLYTIDAPTGAATLVGPVTNGGCLIGIAVDGNGDLWGYDIIADVLLSIDKNTGAGTIVGSIGFDANFGQGMGWDPNTDTLYMAAFNSSAFQAELRTVDRNTGNTALVGVLGSTTPGGLTQLPWLGFEIGGGGDAIWLDEDPITGTVAAGSMEMVDIIFDASVVTQTGTYTAEIRFDGTFDNDVLPAQVVMHVVADASFDVTVGADPDAQSGDAGETVAYTVWMTNTGTVADTYNLTLSGNDWDTTLSANSITIETGEADSVTVWVDIPAGALGNEMDVVTVEATSVNDPTATGAVDLTTSVTAVYAMEMSGDMADSGAPGSTVMYALTITNTGNVTDTYDLTLGTHSWTATFPGGNSVTVAAGASTTVMLHVDIPSGATDGQTDAVMVTATSANDSSVTASATMTTTAVVTGYTIYLPIIRKP